MMNVLLLLSVSVSVLTTLASGECPPAAAISPCICKNGTNYDMESLFCEGSQITDLRKVFGTAINATDEELYVHFGELRITNTAITSIEDGSFGAAVFHAINITDNPMLSEIDARAFGNTAALKTLDVLEVVNSPKLTSALDLFSLVNYLQPQQYLQFTNLGIQEIPAYAFSENLNLFVLSITENPIKSIGKSAFFQLKNVTTVILNHNMIADIDIDGITFNETNPDDLYVILNSNKLTASSFHPNFINIDLEENADFEINDNQIETLKESIFKPIILSKGVKSLSLGGNKLICDCGLKWIIDIKNVTEKKLAFTVCADKNNTSIFALKPEDFGSCS